MPTTQTALTSLNMAFGTKQVAEIDQDLFGPGQLLSDAAMRLGVDDHGLARYLDQLPAAVHDALRATIASAIERGQGITFAWMPGYDYELTVTDVGEGPVSPGGVTVLLKSPYR
jgi:hypothetical protein